MRVIPLQVIVEGRESEGHVEKLKGVRIEIAQGLYFPPVGGCRVCGVCPHPTATASARPNPRSSSLIWAPTSPPIVEAEPEVVNFLLSSWNGAFGVSHKAFEHERQGAVRSAEIVPPQSGAQGEVGTPVGVFMRP